ncbi:hypothetical protein ACER0C_024694 [Sarotherodon galilaeus]
MKAASQGRREKKTKPGPRDAPPGPPGAPRGRTGPEKEETVHTPKESSKSEREGLQGGSETCCDGLEMMEADVKMFSGWDRQDQKRVHQRDSSESERLRAFGYVDMLELPGRRKRGRPQ